MNIGTIEGLLRLKDEFSTTLRNAQRNLTDAGARMQEVGGRVSAAGSGITALAAPIAALAAVSVKAAITFESSFTGVRKTLDTTGLSAAQAESEFAKLSRGLRDLAAGPRPIPVDVNQLNAIAEAAGQLGIARGDIIDFTRTVADLAQTTNLAAEEGATSLAQFQNIFGAVGKDVDRLGSTIVALGNNGASTERDIVSMGLRIAGAGTQIGLTQGEVLAFASSLSSMGIEAEAGGSAISKVMIDIAIAVTKGGRELSNFAAVAGLTATDFQRLFKQDAASAITAFIEGLGRMKSSGQDVLGTLDKMGITEVRMRDALLRASGAGNLLRDSLNLQARAWRDNNALQNEAAQRYKTTESQIRIVWNRLKDQAITIGQALLPAVLDLLKALSPLVEMIGRWARAFALLPSPVRNTIIVVGALAVAIGPLLIVTGQLISAWGSVIALAPKMGAAITLATGPWGLIAAAIVAATAAIVIWIDKWREASEEATRIAVKLGNLEGAARSFYLDIKAQGGKVQDTILSQAWKDADQLARELLKAQEELKRLQTISENKRDKNGILPFAPDQALIAAGKIAEAQANVNSLSSAYERMKQGLRSVKEVIKTETEPSLQDLLDQLLNNSNGVNIVTEDMEKLGDQLAELQQDLALAARQSLQLARAYAQLAPPETIANIKRAHALETAFLQDVRTFGIDAAKSLQLLRAADYDAAQQAAQSEAVWTTYTESIKRALAALAEAAGSKLLEEFTRNAERELAKFEQTAAELQRRLRISGDLRRDTEYEIRISTVDEVTPRLRNIEESYISFLRDMGEGSVTRGEEIMAAMSLIFKGFTDEVRANLATLEDIRIADRVRGAASATVTSPLAIYRAERAEIVRIMQDSTSKVKISAEDATAYLNKVLEDSILAYAAQWGELFSYLGSQFGGLFQQISQAISNVQAAYKAGSQFGGMMQQAGMMGAAAGSAMGYMAGTLAVMYEIYKAVDAQIEKNKRRKWGDVTQLEIVDGQWSQLAYSADRNGKEVAQALRSYIREIMDAVGGVLDDLPQITIRARKDGKEVSAYVAGVFVGVFGDAQEAIEEAVRYAITHASFAALSQEMSVALTASMDATMEELQRNIQTAQSALTARLGDVGAEYAELSSDWLREIQAAQELGLAIDDMIAARNRELDALKNDVLGLDTAAADRLRALGSLNAGMLEAADSTRAFLEQQIAAVQAQIDFALQQRPGQGARGTGEGGVTNTGQGPGGVIYDFSTATSEAVEELRRQLDAYRRELDKIPQGLSDIEVNMTVFDTLFSIIRDNDKLSAKYAEDAAKYARIKVEAEIAALELQLRTLGKWEEFAGMFADVANFLRETAGETGKPRRGSGAGSSDRDSVRDFLRDRAFELGLRGLTEYQRAVAETTRQYDTLLQQAGKDNALRAQLIALRQQELDLLAREQVQSVVGRFREFLGLVSPFDQVRETAAALIKDIQGSPFGDARKARMIGRVLEDVDRQITKLSREMAVSLSGSLLQDLQRYGAESQLQADIRNNMAMLEHMLALENYRITIEKLKAEGKIAPEMIAKFEEAYNFLAGLDWETVINPPGGGGPPPPYDGPVFQGYEDAATAIQSVGDSLAEMTELLQRYRDQGLSPYQLALRDLNADFTRIRAVLGDTAEVSLQYQLAIARLRDEYLSSMRDFYDEITTGPMSGLSVESQYAAALANWNSLTSAIAATGDLSLSDEAVEAAQQAQDLAAQLWGTTTGGYQQLLAQFRATMEALGIGGAPSPASAAAAASTAASSLFAGLTPDLLQGVSGVLQRTSAALTSGGEDFASGDGFQAGLQAQVDATEGVGSAIEVHGSRQERLLGELVTGINTLVALMREERLRQQAGGGSGSGSTGTAGNAVAMGASGIMYGDPSRRSRN